MRAVFRHELSSYFTTAVGYVFLTMYALLSGLVFVFINIGQEMSASMNLLFSGMQLPLLLIAPLLTMRLFAEEKRMRTDQLLLTSPVPLGQIVLGKALASLALLMIAMRKSRGQNSRWCFSASTSWMQRWCPSACCSRRSARTRLPPPS